MTEKIDKDKRRAAALQRFKDHVLERRFREEFGPDDAELETEVESEITDEDVKEFYARANGRLRAQE